MLALVLGTSSLAIWLIIALLPWRPWSTSERLDSEPSATADLSDLTVLIPARNESEVIIETLSSIIEQAPDSTIILVDDQSTDGTAELAKSLNHPNLSIINGQDTAEGWSGKLYALEQGRQHVTTPYLLLLDADIALKPGILATLKSKMLSESLSMLSLMAELKMHTFWEKLLMPAFIYFFKLLYPFHLSNKPNTPIAAAAGGCILLKTEVLSDIGGFAAIRSALIDDCSLAKTVKQHGHSIWTGLTHSVVSQRSYENLASIWLMVTRTAFSQLYFSYLLLSCCIVLMGLAYIVPVFGIVYFSDYAQLCASLALIIMFLLYLPTLLFYQINLLWCLSMPIAAFLYIIMTCDSALKHTFGKGAEWKGRRYQ